MGYSDFNDIVKGNREYIRWLKKKICNEENYSLLFAA